MLSLPFLIHLLERVAVVKGGRWFQNDLNIFLYIWQLIRNN